MAEINNIGIYKGGATTLLFTMNPVVDVAGWTVTLTVRVNAEDAAYLIQKSPAAIVSPSANGQFRFVLTHADTVALSVGNYAYDVQRVDVGNETCLSIGKLAVTQEVLY